MSPKKRYTKLILAGLLTLAFLTTATASLDIKNGVVWTNSQKNVTEITATCSGDATVDSIRFSGSINETFSDSSLSTNEINNSDLASHKVYKVSYSCNNSTDYSDFKEISLKKASITESGSTYQHVNTGAVGFVGEQLSFTPYTTNFDYSDDFYNRRPIEINLDLKEVYQVDDIDASNFRVSGGLGEINSISKKASDNSISVTLSPSVNSYFDQRPTLTFEKGDVRIEEKLDVLVHPWKVEDMVSAPGRQLSFDQVKNGAFTYDMQISYKGHTPSDVSLDQGNFRLTVYKKKRQQSGSWKTQPGPYKESEYNSKAWLSESNPSASNVNYRVSIDNMKPLKALDKGRYVFQFEIRYKKDGKVYSYVVDRTSVDKSAEFSGVVRDSTGAGVKTSMELIFPNKVKQVNTGSDGSFSVPVSGDVRSMQLSYYYRDKASADSKVTLDNPKISGNSDLGKGGSALKYQYWSNPKIDISGLRPANMMAVKFGYPIKGGVDSMSINFNSENLNPEKLQVYECSYWNFAGKTCLGQWSKKTDFSVNYATWTANLNSVDTYKTPSGEKILMNAYVLGTSSKITLKDSINLKSSRIRHNGVLKASGVLVSSTGDRVSGANVTLSLVGENRSQSWGATTDSTGTFEIGENDKKVTLPAGNYVLKLEASKNPYQSFEMTSEKTVEVYYETGVRLEAPTSKEVVQGNKSRIGIEVSNSGQQPIKDVELKVNGVKSRYYSLSSDIETIDAGESRTVELVLDFPEDYCSLPCGSPPQLDISVSGTSSGEDVSDSMLTSVILKGGSSTGGSQDAESQDRKKQGFSDKNSSRRTNSSASPISTVKKMTGNFVQKQGELNIALGIIFLFTMMLALSVKKKKSSSDDGRRGNDRRRPQIQKPPVSSDQVQEVEPKETSSGKEEDKDEVQEDEPEKEDVDGTEDENRSEEASEEDVYVCSVCGEEFESESGRDLHEEAVH